MTPVLETERLTLRPILQDDYRFRYEIFSDQSECNVFGVDAYADTEAASRQVADYKKMDEVNFARHWTIVLKSTGQPIGFCDVYLPSPHLRSLGICEVSYALQASYRRYGFMREALVCALSHMIVAEGFFRVEASINSVNIDSIQLLAQLGFRYEGVQRKKWIWDGVRQNMMGYALLADEFNLCKRPS